MTGNLILTKHFYSRSTLTVAAELLGKTLKFFSYKGVITETEAYIGQEDPACHASKGYTKRTAAMFGPPGFSYIYFIYGMYYCFNAVTEKQGYPAAVLIRGIKLIEPNTLDINGPGKLCKTLSMTKEHNQQDLTLNHNFCIYNSDISPNYICTPRIGISKGKEKFWRFCII
ncbi:DNA-3-methyladenine glycosylase [Candidatus Mesenet endosymbiont of Phosphuga atrata]|uniref:DNA-3-methyladenine glycosylase n=1 Tax=Candidatus Mesenet endosymbiont of Phosphuga atrata TaxID=3066221 RepID=UPI0030CBC16D